MQIDYFDGFSRSYATRLTGSAQPETGSIAYVYDSVGNLQTRTDARGIVSAYGYYALNRVT